jgi:hypothetical protein
MTMRPSCPSSSHHKPIAAAPLNMSDILCVVTPAMVGPNRSVWREITAMLIERPANDCGFGRILAEGKPRQAGTLPRDGLQLMKCNPVGQLYLARMLRTLPAGFISPRPPTKIDKLPVGQPTARKQARWLSRDGPQAAEDRTCLCP